MALPSIFIDLDTSYLIKITQQNFALKLGFIFILQFAIGYILSYSIAVANRRGNMFNFFSASLFIILVTCWLTFFNLSEILFSKKLESISQHIGMLIVLVITLFLQGFQILTSEWSRSYYDAWSSNTEDEYNKIKREKAFLDGKIFFFIVLVIFEFIYFVAYWLN